MNDTENVRAFIDNYFEAVNTGDLDRIPIADDCIYDGAMLSEPIHGAEAVREYIAQFVPFVEHFEPMRTIVEGNSAAAMVHVKGLGEESFDGAVFFELSGGKLVSLVNFFDTHPLFRKS
jgi:ketosteroid isomerase-like protein